MNKKLLSFAFLFFFTAQNVVFAQNNSPASSPNTSQVSHPNLHYFLISTKSGSLKGKTSRLNSVFTSPRYNLVEVNESQSILKLTAFKGTKIEDIKLILSGLNIGIKNFREEYANSAPAFFQNH